MTKKILPYIILLSALSVSGSAAFYSIDGLSKLFAGASLQVIIMASCLEVAKLVIATLLHQYWEKINTILKIYLTSAVIILVLITSAGIYGFLSAAYQKASIGDKKSFREIELIDSKLIRFNEVKTDLEEEKKVVETSISDLRTALGGSHIQYIDKKTGEKISSSSSSVRKSLENQLKDATLVRDRLSDRYQTTMDSITKFDIQKIELINSSESASDLGPLRYISSITNISMDKVINYFILLIIFVFDPLAISLILAANFAFEQKSKNRTIKQTINNPSKDNVFISPDAFKDKDIKQTEMKHTSSIKLPVLVKKDEPTETINDEIDKFAQSLAEEQHNKKLLDQEQIRNMSHQEVKNILRENV